MVWLIVLLLVGKVLAASLTLSIGGSGGVFAPSLFIGAMAGMAFGVGASAVFGPSIGPPAMYAVIAMGGVFAAAAQAPLTAIASVVEMTGNFGITIPIMLASGVASAVSKQLSYGSVYTTKLLRRGIDIERPRTAHVLQSLTVADVMQPVTSLNGPVPLFSPSQASEHGWSATDDRWQELAGVVSEVREPQELFGDETLEQALRQLTMYGHAGLPVLSDDRSHVQGWITRQGVLRALDRNLQASSRAMPAGAVAADFGADDPQREAFTPSTPLSGYEIVEIAVRPGSPAIGRSPDEVQWPPGSVLVAVRRGDEIAAPTADAALESGERLILLAPSGSARQRGHIQPGGTRPYPTGRRAGPETPVGDC